MHIIYMLYYIIYILYIMQRLYIQRIIKYGTSKDTTTEMLSNFFDIFKN